MADNASGKQDQAQMQSQSVDDMGSHGENERESNYMFFENIKTIQHHLSELASLNTKMIDDALCNGHDWAEDHMAVAKENIEQVAHFFMNMQKK